MDASALRWAQWEREDALFNADTGETHLLGQLPSAVVTVLSERPLSLDALCDELARNFHLEVDANYRATVRHVLESLADLELVQRHPL